MKLTLHVRALLAERDWTAYELAKRSEGHISMSVAYRLAADEWQCLTRAHLTGLCLAFGFDSPGKLFEPPKTTRKRRTK